MNQNQKGKHIPILLEEIIQNLNLKEGDTVVDCTTNRAGHSIEIAKKIGTSGKLICIDLDEVALEEAKANLSKIKNLPSVIFINKNFREIENILKDLNIDKVNAVLADLGISSQELDISGRGFTFQNDEPLLMTFNSNLFEDTLTAKDVVNDWSEETLADVIYYFSDEIYAKRIAKKIVETRKEKEIKTTFELAQIINSAVPAKYKNGKINPATKTFQALRMAVNDELGSIKDLINSLERVMFLNARAAFLTFHSIEDRIVKQTARENQNLKQVNKKPLIPNKEEIKNNPRARSAKLRIYEYEYNN